MTTIYHVTKEWDGGDLRSLARQMDDGDLGLDEGLAMVAEKWTEGGLAAADRYLDGDGRYVHFHSTLAEAVDYRDEWCVGGAVLAVDADGLDVGVGDEYPHPVVADAVPADRVRVELP